MTIKELIIYLEDVSVKSGDEAKVMFCTGATTHESIDESTIDFDVEGEVFVYVYI